MNEALSSVRPTYVSEPGILRKCAACGHFECPLCRVWCDSFEGDEMCCGGECVYDRPPDERLDAFLQEHRGKMYDSCGIGTGGQLSEREDGAVVLTLDSPAEVREAEIHSKRRSKMKNLGEVMRGVLKSVHKDVKGVYLVLDFGEERTFSAIYRAPGEEAAARRIGDKAKSDFAEEVKSSASEEAKSGASEEVKSSASEEVKSSASEEAKNAADGS